MIGESGDDTYIVNHVNDVVTELSSEGTDLIESSVSYTTSSNVENLTLESSRNIKATDNSWDIKITGNSRKKTSFSLHRC